MKTWLALLLSFLLSACAAISDPQQAAPADHLFHDALFAAPSERISADDVFAVTPDMRRYLQHDMAQELKAKGPKQGLFDALNRGGHLQLAYDTEITRNAAQTFAARSGNCLSLVIMTSALAKQLGLSVEYHLVSVDATWRRSGNTYFSIGHVNLSLEKKELGALWRYDIRQILTIDFLPPLDTAGYRTRPLDEKTIVAMYMNNRAAETMAQQRLDDAYWWAREAVRQDPGFASAYNTLGAIYQRHGNLLAAHEVLREALNRDPRNTVAMYNLANVLTDLGRTEEAQRITAALARLEPYPPYYFFDLGMAAMQRNDFVAARSLFDKEVARDPGNHEFHYWLGTAHWRLGNITRALHHLRIAQDNSPTQHDHAIYAAKFDRIKSENRQSVH